MREIQAFLKEMYAVDVSADLSSTVTDAVVAEVTAGQSRPLEPMYPVVFFVSGGVLRRAPRQDSR
jgi:putative transposase